MFRKPARHGLALLGADLLAPAPGECCDAARQRARARRCASTPRAGSCTAAPGYPAGTSSRSTPDQIVTGYIREAGDYAAVFNCQSRRRGLAAQRRVLRPRSRAVRVGDLAEITHGGAGVVGAITLVRRSRHDRRSTTSAQDGDGAAAGPRRRRSPSAGRERAHDRQDDVHRAQGLEAPARGDPARLALAAPLQLRPAARSSTGCSARRTIRLRGCVAGGPASAHPRARCAAAASRSERTAAKSAASG